VPRRPPAVSPRDAGWDRLRRAASGSRQDEDHGARREAADDRGDSVSPFRLEQGLPRGHGHLLGAQVGGGLRARIWGCRGSLPTPGRETLRYGGNTSCVEVELDDGTRVILDAGTGIRALGLQLNGDRGRSVHVCLTHLHLDHIEGLGFFAPIWQPGNEIHVWGPPSATRSLKARIARYLSAPLF